MTEDEIRETAGTLGLEINAWLYRRETEIQHASDVLISATERYLEVLSS